MRNTEKNLKKGLLGKYMIIKKTLIIISLILFSSSLTAGSSCHFDYWGNYICTSTGNTGNWNSQTTTDYWGNDNTTIYDNDSNSSSSYSCHFDYWGNYICN